MKTTIRLLIKISIAWAVAQAVYAFEGADKWFKFINLKQLKVKEELDTQTEPQVPAEMLEELNQAREAYFIVRDEVKHILPLFVGALEGIGAGAVFTKYQLLELCREVANRLKSSASCEHAANIANGLRKEAIWRLRERRAEHEKEYLAKLRALEQGLEEKKSVATSTVHENSVQAFN